MIWNECVCFQLPVNLIIWKLVESKRKIGRKGRRRVIIKLLCKDLIQNVSEFLCPALTFDQSSSLSSPCWSEWFLPSLMKHFLTQKFLKQRRKNGANWYDMYMFMKLYLSVSIYTDVCICIYEIHEERKIVLWKT